MRLDHLLSKEQARVETLKLHPTGRSEEDAKSESEARTYPPGATQEVAKSMEANAHASQTRKSESEAWVDKDAQRLRNAV